jgi:hypothetical protein
MVMNLTEKGGCVAALWHDGDRSGGKLFQKHSWNWDPDSESGNNPLSFEQPMQNFAARTKVDLYIHHFLVHQKAMLHSLAMVLAGMGRKGAGYGTLAPSDNGRKRALVMVLNEGYLGLFYNWVCSCNSLEIDISNLVLFVPTPELAKTMSNLGFNVFHHEGLSIGFHSAASQAYGDSQFMEAMWLKNLSVQLLLSLGWDVLFQDVDMIWQADPWPYILELSDRYGYDALFQDDTQYQPRFDPLWANSGFFFIKATRLTKRLWRRQFWSYELMVYYNRSLFTPLCTVGSMRLATSDPTDLSFSVSRYSSTSSWASFGLQVFV